MTQFKLDRYDVLVQDGDNTVAHQVTIYHADELAAEREAPKYGLTVKVDDEGNPDISGVLGAHLQTLQVYCVLKRTGLYKKPFAVFMNTDCLALQEVEDLVLDPTQPEDDTTSPSSSPRSGPRSRSGSTPTSTSD